MKKKYFAVEVVRRIEDTVEIIVEAPDEQSAHGAALDHLRTHAVEYQWFNPRTDLAVWRKREIATLAIVDAVVQD